MEPANEWCKEWHVPMNPDLRRWGQSRGFGRLHDSCCKQWRRVWLAQRYSSMPRTGPCTSGSWGPGILRRPESLDLGFVLSSSSSRDAQCVIHMARNAQSPYCPRR